MVSYAYLEFYQPWLVVEKDISPINYIKTPTLLSARCSPRRQHDGDSWRGVMFSGAQADKRP
jgi:hypothetical protein